MNRIVLGTATAVLVAFAGGAAAQAAPSAADDARRILGVTISASGTDRDTLGLLISAVTPDGPADRASIGAGSRLAEVNGANLRIDPADIGRRQAQDGALSRLAKELNALQPGDSATLRVFASGRARTVTIRTAKAPEVRQPAPAPTPVPAPAAAAASLKGVADGIAELRTQLVRLIQDETVAARRDTLMRLHLELGAIEGRLRAIPAEPTRVQSSDQTVPGLRTTPVWDELVDYLGADSRNGLLVLEADSTWAPVRKGDVIVRVNGELVDLDLLRGALDPRRETRLDLLRGGRSLTVILHPRD
ncbi:MAG TPA: hypothetical protein VLV16_07000 [Gemmatimonadales bacterium]|nr:hypothetical protein [Gemmatimonadales bacterium]